MGKRVLAAYERARSWALANPQDVVTILAAAAKLPPDVAVREPGRVDRGNPRVGAPTRAAIAAAAPILKASGSLTAGASLDQAQATLFDNSVATP
jgi:sulfonate transport system substrate-binding protein